jgi:preprotein translocase subunit YajC
MAAAAQTGSDLTLTLLYMALIVGVFYFLWFRPQQAQRKKAREMLAALAPGDRVMTAGGLVGTLRSLEDSMVEVEIADGVTVTFTKRAIIERILPVVPAPGDE